MSCEYCGTDWDNRPLVSLASGYVKGAVLIEGGNTLRAWAVGTLDIAFFPMCGRGLRDSWEEG